MARIRLFLRCAAPLLVAASAWAQKPLGEMFVTTPGAPAAEQPAGTGMSVLPGSELSAGMAPAVLRLARGGQVRICPRSRISVNNGGQGMMLGMGVGAAEIDYGVASGTTDVFFTPDFEIRLAGPAHYHFAVGVTSSGDTCFKPLLGNTSGVVFSELLGQELFGAGADEATLFPGGKITHHAALTDTCGCPAPPAVKQASAPPEPPAISHADSSPTSGAAPSETKERSDQPAQNHIEVETPFVFSGSAAPIPGSVAKIQFSSLPNTVLAQEDPEPIVLAETASAPGQAAKAEPTPTPTPEKKEKKGFMARLKGFFGGLFHR
jgi:hypothetical protein